MAVFIDTLFNIISSRKEKVYIFGGILTIIG